MDLSPLIISLKTAFCSITITFFLGIWSAWKIVNLKNRKLRLLWDGILTLPLVLPPTVAGLLLLLVFSPKRMLGHIFLEVWGIRLTFSFAATVLAACVISFPLMYRSARGAFEQLEDNLIDAARTLGMKERDIFFKVALASAFPGILSGGVMAFARGMGEFGATAMVAGNIAGRTRTLALAVYSETAAGNMDRAFAYGAVLTAAALLCLLLINGLGEKQYCPGKPETKTFRKSRKGNS